MNLKYYKIDVKSDLENPPFFSTSMIRGAFGLALKKVVCINPAFRCNNCFIKDNCIYYDFYEMQNSFKKFRITSKLGMKHLTFSIYLYEDKTKELPYILAAIKKALKEIGLGKEKRVVNDLNISIGKKEVYKNGDFLPINDIEPFELNLDKYYKNIKIKFITPVSLKYKNEYITKDKIKTHILIINLYKRFLKLKDKPNTNMDFQVEGEIVKNSLKPLDLFRYSNRKRKHMKLSGLIGEIHINNIDKNSYNYLKIGEIIGIGKNGVFGFGDYKIEPI